MKGDYEKSLKPAGFQYLPDFLSETEEKDLIQHIQLLNWQPVKMHGVIAKRRVVHFGLDYSYSTRTVQPTDPPPAFLNDLIQRTAILLQVSESELAEILISEYFAGAGIGWHRDAPVFDRIVGVSLLGSCVIKLRTKKEDKFITTKTELAPRSAYLLSGPSRWKWQHHIPPVKHSRYSITFRTLNK